MAIIDDLFHLMTGSFGGIPSIAIMAVPFIIGLIIGYLIKKAIKIGLILVVIAFVASYFGLVNLGNLAQEGKNLAVKYGPTALSYVALFFGIIPLSLGLVIGLVLGFIL
jgi:uncharacterized membrane protein (Fun14 family)